MRFAVVAEREMNKGLDSPFTRGYRDRKGISSVGWHAGSPPHAGRGRGNSASAVANQRPAQQRRTVQPITWRVGWGYVTSHASFTLPLPQDTNFYPFPSGAGGRRVRPERRGGSAPRGTSLKSVTVTNRGLRSHFLHNVPFLFTWWPHRGKVHVLPRKRVTLEVSILAGKRVAHKVSVLSRPFVHFPGKVATAVVWTHPVDMYHDCSVLWATSKPVVSAFPPRIVQPDSTAYLVLGPLLRRRY
ncbi:hypothetical protein E2C01_057941 [Portunus trituberculatus]|uniref:Uncharacterized protein n=1 Tax=Portunus trituberculatus TaxID=210409 RepID=A0A5B7H2F8_PORTR|nr:hypothetical protein [Portunus trituberculatus]